MTAAMHANYCVGVFAIIFDPGGRVLLCHRRDQDMWNLPGGCLEGGEAPWDGVVREVREETGLEAGVYRLAGVYSKPDKDEIVFSFICHVSGGALTLTDEAVATRWHATLDVPWCS